MKQPENLEQAAAHTSPDYADYRETADITTVHSAVHREHGEPETGEVPLPLWFLGICAACIAGASFYFGAFNGGFSGESFSETAGAGQSGAVAKAGAKPGEGAAAQEKSPFEFGKTVFAQNCQTCHQATGQGLPGAFPPLAGSPWVLGSEKRVAMIVLKGLQGPLTVNGASFNGAMPAWEKSLNDKKIAAVLTYVRNEWGNKAGEISPEKIAAARKEFAARAEPWAQADLEAVPADATLEGGAPASAPVQK